MRNSKSTSVVLIALAFVGLSVLLSLVTAFLNDRAMKHHDVVIFENKLDEWRKAGSPSGTQLQQYIKKDKRFEWATNIFDIDMTNFMSFIVLIEPTGHPYRSLYLTTNGYIIYKPEGAEAKILSIITK